MVGGEQRLRRVALARRRPRAQVPGAGQGRGVGGAQVGTQLRAPRHVGGAERLDAAGGPVGGLSQHEPGAGDGGEHVGVGRPAAGLVARRAVVPAGQVGTVELDPLAPDPAQTHREAHRRAQPPHDRDPGGVGDAELARHRLGRGAVRVGAHHVRRPEPLRERELGVGDRGAARRRELPAARRAAELPAARHPGVDAVPALWAREPSRPPERDHVRLAGLLRAEPRHELRHAAGDPRRRVLRGRARLRPRHPSPPFDAHIVAGVPDTNRRPLDSSLAAGLRPLCHICLLGFNKTQSF